MNEEYVKSIAMNGEFVMNNVMKVKIDPKVVMDLSIFEVGGWNNFQSSSQHLSKQFMDDNEPWLLVGIQRSIPCDTMLGETLCEFRTTHEEIDVTS